MPIPEPPLNEVDSRMPATDKQWRAWADEHYPYDERWETYLKTRKERPVAGSEQELDDLRGIDRFGSYGPLVGYFARQWFYSRDHRVEIEKIYAIRREFAQRKERQRLVALARLAVAGKLGNSPKQQENAKATAQTFLDVGDPGSQSIERLQDWYAMHVYGMAISAGRNVKRPVLHRDKTSLRDIDDAIGAQPAGRPQQREMF